MPSSLRSTVLLPAFLLLIGPAALHAQANEKAVDQAANRAAIQAIVQGEADAWNRGDAVAFAAHFAPDGSFTNIVGMQTYGRAPFQAQHERIFSTIYKGSRNSFTMGRVHFIRPDVAVADVDGVLSNIVSAPPDTPVFPDGSIHVKLQLVLSQQNGAWQIDSFHNVTVNPHVGGGPPR